jgi:hypothetical protein
MKTLEEIVKQQKKVYEHCKKMSDLLFNLKTSILFYKNDHKELDLPFENLENSELLKQYNDLKQFLNMVNTKHYINLLEELKNILLEDT